MNNSPRRQRDKLLKEAIRQASIYDDNIDTNARQKEISATQVNLTTRIGVDVNPKGAAANIFSATKENRSRHVTTVANV